MNIADIGRRGVGKSTLALDTAFRLSSNVLVFDTNNQFKNADYRTSSFKKVKELLDKSKSWGDDKRLYLAYVPMGDVETEWDIFSDIIWCYGDYALIIDEAHRLQKPQYINQKLDRLLRQAPKRERGDTNPIDVIQCFHRPVDMNGIVLSLLDYVYMFRVTRSRDLEYIEKEFTPEIAEIVSTLKTPPDGRDVLRIHVETNEFLLLTDPSKWYTKIQHPSTSKPSNFEPFTF